MSFQYHAIQLEANSLFLNIEGIGFRIFTLKKKEVLVSMF